MNVELIQPKDGNPSVYRDTIDRRGYGFHHVGVAVADVERERAAYAARGYREAFVAPVPSGGSVVYLESGNVELEFVELIPATAGMDEMFTRFLRTTVDWDGVEPVRPFG